MCVLREPQELRLFLAAGVSAEVVAAAHDFRAQVGPYLPKARWTHRDDLHVTLKFFGATSPERLAALIPVVSLAAAATRLFVASFRGIDVFTPRRKPQILWGRVHEGQGEFCALATRLEDGLDAIGFAKEGRSFQPHLTLARLSPEALRLGAEVLAGADFKTPPFRVDTVTLYASDLAAPPGAARYRPLHVFPFQGTSLADRQEDHT